MLTKTIVSANVAFAEKEIKIVTIFNTPIWTSYTNEDMAIR